MDENQIAKAAVSNLETGDRKAENREKAPENTMESVRHELAAAQAECAEAERAISRAEDAGADAILTSEFRAEEQIAAAELRQAAQELESADKDSVSPQEDFSIYESMDMEALKTEAANLRSQYDQALEDVQEAVGAGSTKAKIDWLRGKVMKVGTRLAYVSRKLYWDFSQEEYATQTSEGQRPESEIDQFVFELNELTEKHSPEMGQGKDFSELLTEAESLRMRYGMEAIENLRRNPESALKAGSAIKLKEMAAELVEQPLQEMEIDHPGEGVKAYGEFLKRKGFDTTTIDEKMLVFKNGLDFRKRMRWEDQLSQAMAKGDALGAVRIYMKSEWPNATQYKHEEISKMVKDECVELAKKNLDSAIGFYRSLPAQTPGLREIEWHLFGKAKASLSGSFNQDVMKEKLFKILDAAPEALIDEATGQYTHQTWTDEERLEILNKIIQNNGHLASAGRFGLSDFGAATVDQARPILARVYLQTEPRKLIANVWGFRKELSSLPNAERQRVKKDFFDKATAYEMGDLKQRLQFVQLTPQEFGEFMDKMKLTRDQLYQDLSEHNPSAVLAKCNADNLLFDGAQKDKVFQKQVKIKPFKLLEDFDLLNLNDSQARELKTALIETMADRLGQSKDAIDSLFGDAGDVSENMKEMQGLVDHVFVLKRMLGDQGFSRIFKDRRINPKEVCGAFAFLRQSGLPQGLVEHYAAILSTDQNPQEAAKTLVKAARELSVEDPGALSLTYEKSPAMAVRLLEAEPQERQAFSERYALAKDKARYLIKKLSPTAYERLFAYDESRALAYLDVFRKIVESPSQEIQRIDEQLADQISDSENPDAAFDKAESVFLRNNLPTVGKVFKIFEMLNPPKVLDKKLANANLSPTLRAEQHRSRMLTIYKDLLNVHIESSNPSLKQYIEAVHEGETIMSKADERGVEGLDEGEKRVMAGFLGKMRMLFENSQLGRMSEESHVEEDLLEEYAKLKENLGVGEGQTVAQRLTEMFFKPLGYQSASQVLARMDQCKADAGERNAEFAAKGKLSIKAGDLLKGVDSRYLRNIMQNGSVAKDYLGASSDSDATPLDTDLGRVTDEDAQGTFREAIGPSPAMEYGNMLLMVRDRGQFIETSDKNSKDELLAKARERKAGLELFNSGAVDQKRHFGIRTGFPMTQVDAILVNAWDNDQMHGMDSLCMDIVQNGYYIPVADREGKVLFSQENYLNYAEKYNVGLEKLGGKSFEMRKPGFEVDPSHDLELEKIASSQEMERERIQETSERIKTAIFSILEELGVKTYAGDRNVAVRPELLDTGSSGRGTNVPGEYDFDFALKLNPNDMGKVLEIQNKFQELLGATDNGSHEGQLRLKDGKLPGLEQNLEIDLAFVSKSELEVYESHQAAKDRFDAMDETTREQVLANVVMAKKVLKQAGVYKKTEGGLGGIGIENFILQNGGSLATAFESFIGQAYKDGNLLPFGEFKAKFKIIDPGINAKFGKHDNFVDQNMTEEGYKRMAQTAQSFLNRIRLQNLREATA